MLGYGLLNILIATLAIAFIDAVTVSTYDALKGLTLSDMRQLYTVAAKCVLLFGLLLFAGPLLAISIRKLRTRCRAKLAECSTDSHSAVSRSRND